MMKKTIVAFLMAVVVLLGCSCSSQKQETSNQDSAKMIEERAVQFSLDTGYEYYSNRVVTMHEYYKSCEKPKLLWVKSHESKYYDVRCEIECIASVLYPNEVDQTEMQYELRLEYLPSTGSFEIVKERWGGF